MKNIYIDFYDEKYERTSLCFITDGGNSIRFINGDKTIWKIDIS